MRIAITFIYLLLSASILIGQTVTGDLLIQNGHVLTITKGNLEETDLLIQKGKIAAIGKDLKAL